MQKFGQYLLRNPAAAGLLTLALASLPFTNWAAGVIVAFVVLRKGLQAGLPLLLLACLPSLLLLLFTEAAWLAAVASLAGFCLLGLAAATLYRFVSWQMLLQVTAVVAALVIIVLHGMLGDIANWWFTYLKTTVIQPLAAVEQFSSAEQTQLLQALQQAATLMTGLVAAGLLASTWLWVALARWWQSLLFNPGQLQPELHNIRMSRSFAVVAMLVMVSALLTREAWLLDIAPVAMAPFIAVALSTVHRTIKQRGLSIPWLVGFYVITVLLFSTVVIVLTVVGWVDSLLQRPLPKMRGE